MAARRITHRKRAAAGVSYAVYDADEADKARAFVLGKG